MSSQFGEIRPWTTELAVQERMKKSHRLVMKKMTSSHLFRYFSSEKMRTCIKSLAEYKIRQDPTTTFRDNR